MTSSLTVTFTGTESVLRVDFLPDIILDDDCDYSCALIDLIIKDCKNTNGEKINLEGIINFNLLYINCDIISNSYINGVQCHRIHQFATRASHVKGGILLETPKHLNYFPIKNNNLRSIQISIVDKDGKPINLSGGDIICRINIKRE